MDVVLENPRLQVIHRYWIRLRRLFDHRGFDARRSRYGGCIDY
ncbi:hypothetical protein [Microbacterium kunmingense]|nr:hypothetical protein [Microbacterium kunmingense]